MELLQIMLKNRSAIWFNRKTKPTPNTNEWVAKSLNQGEDQLDRIKHMTGRFHQEYILSDDHFRLFDLFMIVHNILDYTTGPIAIQKDFKDPMGMVPNSTRPQKTGEKSEF